MDGTNETPELRAFNRYVTLLEERDRIADDIKSLDAEMKQNRISNLSSIKRLAAMSVSGTIGKEVLKFRALQEAAARCEQLKLFKEL